MLAMATPGLHEWPEMLDDAVVTNIKDVDPRSFVQRKRSLSFSSCRSLTARQRVILVCLEVISSVCTFYLEWSRSKPIT